MLNWKIQKQINEDSADERFQEIVNCLFFNRGLKKKVEIKEFQNPKNPLKIKLEEAGFKIQGFKKAISRIKKAIKNQQPIFIYGDYDADGICATAVLWEGLYALEAKVIPFIPLRKKHGYGLKKEGIDEILNQPVVIKEKPLIITVDNGIVAHEGVAYARQQGIEVIITDHHQPGAKLPKASAVVYSTKLSGTGVAWFLAREILGKKNSSLASSLLELAAIGTLADMMPLNGVNRSIVKVGLLKLGKTKRLGLKVIFKTTNLIDKVINSHHINFILAPRLNASGRLESALDSLRLLCTRDKQRALKLNTKLNKINQKRQELTKEALEHARGIKRPRKKLVFVADSSYHPGVIGLVAGRLVEEHYRPAIVISKGKVFSRGSGRSIKSFNMIKSLRKLKNLFVDLGGHPMAAGFTIKTKNLTKFKQKMTALAEKQLSKQDLTPVLKIDCQLKLTDVTQRLYKTIAGLSPFGIANRRPVFCSKKVKVVSVRAVGSDYNHLKLQVQQGKVIDAIAFKFGYLADEIKINQEIDLAYTIDENFFNHRRSLQLKVRDIKLSN